MDIDFNTKHPAQRASFISPQMVKEKNKEAWLALFAEDAVIQDPVGPSALDPSGEGHRGKAAISKFWDMVNGGNFSFTMRESYPCGDECANVWVGTNELGGMRFDVPMVTIYKVNAAGKIVSLRAFWDSSKVAADLAKLAGG
jgi:ketosteroid isomerase-like protein